MKNLTYWRHSNSSDFFNSSNILEYHLSTFHRSNQDTFLINRPSVKEGDWVQPGDLLADCSSSIGGELSLGQNILIAYMPWEGYNYEDAILINERLVFDDLYTSIHIEKYDIEIRETKFGFEQITKNIPHLSPSNLNKLDHNGIIKKGSWVQEGDVLVGKVTPLETKFQSSYQKLLYTILEKEFQPVKDSSLRVPKGLKARVIDIQFLKIHDKKKNPKVPNLQCIHVYLAEKRRIQVGDKVAGRHGNKGIISRILPRYDMPYLPDGTPVDMVLNPLGVPSRMNVGQIYECLLGLAGKYLGERYKIFPFDESYGAEASRSLVYSKLYEAKKKTGQNWLFNPNYPGKLFIFDGRTGDCFDQAITVGYAYILKLVHLVDDKIHCLTQDHQVLTMRGWIPIAEVHTRDLVALLKNGQLIYEKPIKVFHFHNYEGLIYEIKNTNIDLKVTINHRMWVSLVPHGQSQKNWCKYILLEAQNIIGKHVKYLKNANWISNYDLDFLMPSVMMNSKFHLLSKIKQSLFKRGEACIKIKNPCPSKRYLDRLNSASPSSVKLNSRQVLSSRQISCLSEFCKIKQSSGAFQYLRDRDSLFKLNFNLPALSLILNRNFNTGWKVPVLKFLFNKRQAGKFSLILDSASPVLKSKTGQAVKQKLNRTLSKIKLDYCQSEFCKIKPSSGAFQSCLFYRQTGEPPVFCRAKNPVYILSGHQEKQKTVTVKNLLNFIFLESCETVLKLKTGLSRNFVSPKQMNMEAWLTFFGIWIDKGKTIKNSEKAQLYRVQIKQNNPKIRTILFNSIKKLGYLYYYDKKYNCITINNKQLYNYLEPFSVETRQRFLPSWVWRLNKEQCQLLISRMVLSKEIKKQKRNSYYTNSIRLADDFSRLCLHAGWSGNIDYYYKQENVQFNYKQANGAQSIIHHFQKKIYPDISPYCLDKEQKYDFSFLSKKHYCSSEFCKIKPSSGAFQYLKTGEPDDRLNGRQVLYCHPFFFCCSLFVLLNFTVRQACLILQNSDRDLTVGKLTGVNSTDSLFEMLLEEKQKQKCLNLQDARLKRDKSSFLFNYRLGKPCPSSVKLNRPVSTCLFFRQTGNRKQISSLEKIFRINIIKFKNNPSVNGISIFNKSIKGRSSVFCKAKKKFLSAQKRNILLKYSVNRRLMKYRINNGNNSYSNKIMNSLFNFSFKKLTASLFKFKRQELLRDMFKKLRQGCQKKVLNFNFKKLTDSFQLSRKRFKNLRQTLLSLSKYRLKGQGFFLLIQGPFRRANLNQTKQSKQVNVFLFNTYKTKTKTSCKKCSSLFNSCLVSCLSDICKIKQSSGAFQYLQNSDWQAKIKKEIFFPDEICSCSILSKIKQGNREKKKLEKQKKVFRGFNVSNKNNLFTNKSSNYQPIQIEQVCNFKGSVYCLEVSSEVFYVRRNGKPVWTGNSRSIGPYSLVTQQPLKGRSKQGGQRLGEMEVWALEAYGAAFILLEMLTLKSDDITGRMTLWSNVLLHKDISIGTPESFKVLICELQALCLDIGLFRWNSKGLLRQIDHLLKLP
nr:RNA polymerase beta subunit protein b [Trochiscia hystrix]